MNDDIDSIARAWAVMAVDENNLKYCDGCGDVIGGGDTVLTQRNTQGHTADLCMLCVLAVLECLDTERAEETPPPLAVFEPVTDRGDRLFLEHQTHRPRFFGPKDADPSIKTHERLYRKVPHAEVGADSATAEYLEAEAEHMQGREST